MNTFLWIISGIVGGIILMTVKDYIFKRFQKKAVEMLPEDVKQTLINLYQQGVLSLKELKKKGVIIPGAESGTCQSGQTLPEGFDSQKLKHGLLSITDPVLWWKEVIPFFNARKLIIYTVIIGAIFGYGWWKGQGGRPVVLSGESFIMQVDHHYLHWDKAEQSLHLQVSPDPKDPSYIKVISVKDIPGLYQQLKPYGFRLKPFAVAGGSLGEKKTGFEGGLGVDVFHWYKWSLNAFLTNLGGYVGTGYKIWNNFDVMLGVGKGYSGDNRVGIFGKWYFN